MQHNTLQNSFVSQSSAMQRRRRAGRVTEAGRTSASSPVESSKKNTLYAPCCTNQMVCLLSHRRKTHRHECRQPNNLLHLALNKFTDHTRYECTTIFNPLNATACLVRARTLFVRKHKVECSYSSAKVCSCVTRRSTEPLSQCHKACAQENGIAVCP